jgi:4-hydroxybenzoate polyprenyltransferase
MTVGIHNVQSVGRFRVLARDIKISHTVFALPWAVLATFMAAGGMPHGGQILLIVLCMITARTAAMAANRLLDARLDALNPRTAGRAIPSGALSSGFVGGVLVACTFAFVLATSGFWIWYDNPWPLALALPILAFICAYPLLKRFTTLCHYYLGLALALAPVCAWIAIAGTLDAPPLWMAAAVLLWTAGFDIIYACQDFESDRRTGVFSIPAAMGIARALWVSRFTHVLCVGALLLLGLSTPLLGTLYFIGVAIAVLLLIAEHAVVRADDLSRVGLAFFTINGIISLLLGTLGLIDVLM